MLYVGFFEFFNENEEGNPMRGHFMYFAEADNPDDVIEVFKKGVKKIAKQPSIGLYGEIMLNSYIEITKLPAEGAMAFYQERRNNPESIETIGCTLPIHRSGISGFEWFPDGGEPKDDEHEYDVSTFLTIPAPKKQPRLVRKTLNHKISL